MSTLTNDALLQLLPQNGETIGDEIWLGGAASTSQSTGVSIRNPVHVVTANGTANAALVLPSILTNANPPFVWIINNGAQTVGVFPFKAPNLSSETVNGATTAFAITTGNSGLFIAIPQQIFRKGNTTAGGTLNWSAVLITS